MTQKVSEIAEVLNEFLTYEASERRLIILGSVFAFCLLTLSTAFVAIIIRLYAKFVTPRLISYQPTSNAGSRI